MPATAASSPIPIRRQRPQGQIPPLRRPDRRRSRPRPVPPGRMRRINSRGRTGTPLDRRPGTRPRRTTGGAAPTGLRPRAARHSRRRATAPRPRRMQIPKRNAVHLRPCPTGTSRGRREPRGPAIGRLLSGRLRVTRAADRTDRCSSRTSPRSNRPPGPGRARSIPRPPQPTSPRPLRRLNRPARRRRLPGGGTRLSTAAPSARLRARRQDGRRRPGSAPPAGAPGRTAAPPAVSRRHPSDRRDKPRRQGGLNHGGPAGSLLGLPERT